MAMETVQSREAPPPPLSLSPRKPQSPHGEEDDEAHEFVVDEELNRLLLPDVASLPPSPPSAVDTNFVTYFVADFMKPGHDQYIRRHPNGLCVIGLAATHIAMNEPGGVTSVDFNVGKSDRSGIKATGKRKRNAPHLDANSALCKVSANGTFYVVRCCVKGSLLEVNDRLIQHPELLNSSAEREGFIAIMMPRPADWLKVKNSLLTREDYLKKREICSN